MSIAWKAAASNKRLAEFLAAEYRKGSGIPVHLFSVVNATMSSFNRSLGVTDGTGTAFLTGGSTLTTYGGNNNPLGMWKALRLCNCPVKPLD